MEVLLPGTLTQSWRMLLRHKRFAALAICSLGIAIALNTTMYGALDAMVRPKLAMHRPDQLYGIEYFGDFRRWIPRTEKHEGILGLRFHQGAAGATVSPGENVAERDRRLREVNVLTVTTNYFALVRPQVAAGRLIGPDDIGAAVPPIVVGERLWNGLFPEKRAFEPSPVRIAGNPRMIVGILRYEAGFPGARTDVWQLPPPAQHDSIPLSLVRLASGVTQPQAEAELKLLALRFSQRTKEDTNEAGFRMRSAVRPPFRVDRFHYALIGAVAGVLLVACANLANLQLARGVARARELATRSAVGATRRQIIGLLLMESAVLAFGGLVLAAVLTWWGMQLLHSYLPPSIEAYVARPQVSWRVGLFAVGATVLCLLLVGLAPALRLSRVDIGQVLKSGAGTGQSRAARRQYGLLVVVEVAMALALLTSASLLMKAAHQVRSFEFGHDVDGLLQAFVGIAGPLPASIRTHRDWSDVVVQRALAVPGIRAAATTSFRRPPRRAISTDDPGGAPRIFTTHSYAFREVSPDFFRVTAIPIIGGRDFSPGEFAEQQVILEERTANLFWPGLDPVGRMIKFDSAHTGEPWLRVVGVAAQVREWFPRNMDDFEAGQRQRRGLGVIYLLSADRPIAASSSPQSLSTYTQLVVRTDTVPQLVAIDLRKQLLEIGPRVIAGNPLTWEQRTGTDALRARQDFMAALFLLFAGSALALATLGVYAIIAHTVAQRTREFGVRIAMGARQRDIRQMVLRDGNVLALLGIAIGLVITWQNARLVRSFVFSDYDRYDSRFFAAASLVLFVTALLASWIPARRAMRINPVEALRND